PSTPVPEDPLPLQRIAELDLVTTPNGTTTRSALDGALAVIGTSPRIAVETTHRAAIVPLVVAGAGATLLPYRLAMEAAGLGAVVVSLAPPLARRGVLVWPREPLSPAAQAFIDLVAEGYPDDGQDGPGPLEGAHPG